MIINVNLGSWAGKYTKTGEYPLNVPKEATVEDVIATLGLPLDEAGLCTVAGKHVARGYILSEGDNIKFFPSIVGG